MDEEELKFVFKKEKRFLGVFACDELPSVKMSAGTALIFNTSPRSMNNGHWISIYKNKNEIYFADSLKLDFILEEYYVTTFLKNNNVRNIKTLPFPVQPQSSRLCGLYAVYFVSNFLNKKPFEKIISVLNTKNLLLNDFIIVNNVEIR